MRMALQITFLLRMSGSKNLLNQSAMRTFSDITLLNIRKSATCSMFTSNVIQRSRCNNSLVNNVNLHSFLHNRPFRVPTMCYKTGLHGERRDEKGDDIFPNNEEMNLRHSVENDYLSWMCNTYMMTLAGLTILNTASVHSLLDLASYYLSWMRNTYMMTLAGLTILNTASVADNWIISKVVFLTAFCNLTAGTMGYLYSLSSLRRRKVMKSGSSFSCQIAAIIHLFLWLSVLGLIAGSEGEEENDDQEKDKESLSA